MVGSDGFRNRAAPLLIAGDPAGSRVEIDDAGIRVYATFDGTTYPLAARLETQSQEARIGVFDGSTVTVEEVIWPSFLKQEAGAPFVSDLGRSGNDLLWQWFTGGGLKLSTGTATVPVPLSNGGIELPRGLPALPAGGVAAPATSTAATTAVSAETKDGGVGDYQFTAYAGRWYEVRYSARGQTDTINTSLDVVIRDGGGSSPGTSSTAIAAASLALPIAAGSGATGLKIADPVQFTAGTHTLAAFYLRTAGAGQLPGGQAQAPTSTTWRDRAPPEDWPRETRPAPAVRR
jgi:hypothetical protein